MNKQVIKYFSKISALTLLFLLWISVWNDYLKAEELDDSFSNLNNYKIVTNKISWHIWVAISTNIWTRFEETNDLPVTIYNDVMDIAYILSNKQVARDKIITNNMILLNEYLNILKTDIKIFLAQSSNREESLNSYIDQLTYRYKNTITSTKNLNLQKSNLLSVYNSTNTDLENLKTKIWNDFSNFDSNSTIENIDKYLKLKEENTYSKTYIIFIDKFVNYFAILNNYNKTLLDTLINNKEIIIKNTQIVLPDSWTEMLKKLNLIYSEEDWKNVQ